MRPALTLLHRWVGLVIAAFLIALGVLVLGLVLFLGEPLTRRLRGRGSDDRS